MPAVNARPSAGLTGCDESEADGGDADARAAEAFDVMEVGEVAVGGAGPKSSAAPTADVSIPANMASQSWEVFAGGAADGAATVVLVGGDVKSNPAKLLGAVPV